MAATAVVFARLKVRLLRNGLRGRGGRAISFWTGGVFGLLVAVLVFAALAGPPQDRDDRLALVVLVFTGLWVGWLVVPLLAFGSDETLDPGRLALLPLTRRRMMAGLLAASTVGVMPLACLLGLAGVVVGFGEGAVAAVLSASGVAVLLALCLASSRAVTTALSRALRSRRWRDVTMVVLSLIGLAVAWGRFLVDDLLDRLGDDVAGDAASVLQWTPPGLVGRAVVEAGDGAVAAPVASLAVAGWCVVGALAGWSLALARLTTEASSGVSCRGRPTGDRSLFPRALAFLPRTRSGAVAAKDLRYLWRDPRGRSQLVSGVPIALGLPLFWAATGEGGGESVLLATGATVFIGLNQMNMFGLDGEALWTNVVAGHDPRADLSGKAMSAVVVSMTVTVVAAVAVAAVTGGWVWLPLALALGAGVAGVMVGIGSIFSVRAPVAMADTKGNLFASPGAGTGCTTGLVMMGGYLLEGLLFAPIAILVGVGLARSSGPALVLAGLSAPVYGWLVWRICVAMAAEHAGDHQPELLAAVTPRRG